MIVSPALSKPPLPTGVRDTRSINTPDTTGLIKSSEYFPIKNVNS